MAEQILQGVFLLAYSALNFVLMWLALNVKISKKTPLYFAAAIVLVILSVSTHEQELLTDINVKKIVYIVLGAVVVFLDVDIFAALLRLKLPWHAVRLCFYSLVFPIYTLGSVRLLIAIMVFVILDVWLIDDRAEKELHEWKEKRKNEEKDEQGKSET